MGRKVCVALVDSEAIEQQSVPNVARLVREAVVMMARDRVRKEKQVKAKLRWQRMKTFAIEEARQVFAGSCNHCWKWCQMEKDIVTLAHRKSKGCNRRGAGSLDEAEASGEEDISVGGFGFCRLETNMVTGRARAR